MLDYGQKFSIIYRYGRILLAGEGTYRGLPGRAIPYMHIICNNPGISQDFIARKLKVDKATVARTIKIMETEGMIERKPGATDKRCYEVYPTEKMLGVRENCTQQVSRVKDIVLEGIDEADLEVFNRVLTKMSENIVASISDEKVREFEKAIDKKMMRDIGKRLEEKGDRE